MDFLAALGHLQREHQGVGTPIPSGPGGRGLLRGERIIDLFGRNRSLCHRSDCGLYLRDVSIGNRRSTSGRGCVLLRGNGGNNGTVTSI